MAPEQVFGEKDLDARTDLWSVGVLMYECLAGVRPTEGANLGQILKLVTVGPFKPLASVAPQVPAPLARVVDSCLMRDRTQRVASALALREALERVKAGTTLDGAEVHQEVALTAPAPRKSRGRVFAALGAGATLLAILGFGVVRARSTPPEPPRAAAVTQAPQAPPAPAQAEPPPPPVAPVPTTAAPSVGDRCRRRWRRSRAEQPLERQEAQRRAAGRAPRK
jgi:eukaryotic-like serine/threonine-protein kinase